MSLDFKEKILAECPFCGDFPVVISEKKGEKITKKGKIHSIFCKCGVSGFSSLEEGETLRKWNRREGLTAFQIRNFYDLVQILREKQRKFLSLEKDCDPEEKKKLRTEIKNYTNTIDQELKSYGDGERWLI